MKVVYLKELSINLHLLNINLNLVPTSQPLAICIAAAF